MHPAEPGRRDGLAQARHGAGSVRRMGDDLGQQRIIERRNARARGDVRVHADALPLGQLTVTHLPGTGTKIVGGILGIDPALDGAALHADVGLRQAQAGAAGDGDLLGDQIHAGHRFGHRMLHLDARVHLQKIERVALLDRPGIPPCRRRDRQALREADRRGMQRARAALATDPGAGVSSTSF